MITYGWDGMLLNGDKGARGYGGQKGLTLAVCFDGLQASLFSKNSYFFSIAQHRGVPTEQGSGHR